MSSAGDRVRPEPGGEHQPLIGPYAAPLCVVCRNLGYFRDGRFTCVAFPRGIPEPIMAGRADHRRPYAGDGGIRFEADPDAMPELVAAMHSLVGMAAVGFAVTARRLPWTSTRCSPSSPDGAASG